MRRGSCKKHTLVEEGAEWGLQAMLVLLHLSDILLCQDAMPEFELKVLQRPCPHITRGVHCREQNTSCQLHSSQPGYASQC